MELPLAHRRYKQQARWTASMRNYLLNRAGLPNAKRTLEVGCGTGAVLQTIPKASHATQYGVDINFAVLEIAKGESRAALLSCGDAHYLPYASGSFDIVFTHFVLLWLRDPASALSEMRRVTWRGGAVLALAEPDYSQRIDEPADLAELGRLQTEALRARGADTAIGSSLRQLFEGAGLAQIESGEIQAEEKAIVLADWQMESEILRGDLTGRVPQADLEELLAADRAAWQSGERVLHIPTYWAIGRVP